MPWPKVGSNEIWGTETSPNGEKSVWTHSSGRLMLCGLLPLRMRPSHVNRELLQRREMEWNELPESSQPTTTGNVEGVTTAWSVALSRMRLNKWKVTMELALAQRRNAQLSKRDITACATTSVRS